MLIEIVALAHTMRGSIDSELLDRVETTLQLPLPKSKRSRVMGEQYSNDPVLWTPSFALKSDDSSVLTDAPLTDSVKVAAACSAAEQDTNLLHFPYSKAGSLEISDNSSKLLKTEPYTEEASIRDVLAADFIGAGEEDRALSEAVNEPHCAAPTEEAVASSCRDYYIFEQWSKELPHVVGVCYNVHRRSWVAHWQKNRRVVHRHFSVRKYGFREARNHAIRHRLQNADRATMVSIYSKFRNLNTERGENLEGEKHTSPNEKQPSPIEMEDIAMEKIVDMDKMLLSKKDGEKRLSSRIVHASPKAPKKSLCLLHDVEKSAKQSSTSHTQAQVNVGTAKQKFPLSTEILYDCSLAAHETSKFLNVAAVEAEVGSEVDLAVQAEGEGGDTEDVGGTEDAVEADAGKKGVVTPFNRVFVSDHAAQSEKSDGHSSMQEPYNESAGDEQQPICESDPSDKQISMYQEIIKYPAMFNYRLPWIKKALTRFLIDLCATCTASTTWPILLQINKLNTIDKMNFVATELFASQIDLHIDYIGRSREILDLFPYIIMCEPYLAYKKSPSTLSYNELIECIHSLKQLSIYFVQKAMLETTSTHTKDALLSYLNLSRAIDLNRSYSEAMGRVTLNGDSSTLYGIDSDVLHEEADGSDDDFHKAFKQRCALQVDQLKAVCFSALVVLGKLRPSWKEKEWNCHYLIHLDTIRNCVTTDELYPYIAVLRDVYTAIGMEDCYMVDLFKAKAAIQVCYLLHPDIIDAAILQLDDIKMKLVEKLTQKEVKSKP